MELHAGSKPFWICVAALRRFVEQESSGCIPLEVWSHSRGVLAGGSLPPPHALGWVCSQSRRSRCLPVNARPLARLVQGAIPDMHAGSQQFLGLQRLYRAKADVDAAAGAAEQPGSRRPGHMRLPFLCMASRVWRGTPRRATPGALSCGASNAPGP